MNAQAAEMWHLSCFHSQPNGNNNSELTHIELFYPVDHKYDHYVPQVCTNKSKTSKKKKKSGFCKWVLYIASEFLDNCFRNVLLIDTGAWRENAKKKLNHSRLIHHTHPLLQAHLRLLNVVFVQKSLDTVPIVRVDVHEVLDLEANENEPKFHLAAN